MASGDSQRESFYKSLVGQIRRSRRAVTVMFTDVEGSTHYWDAHGDVKGRLMVDLHNRLVCPVIKRFRGRVVKHVGDAIMASFKSPRNAIRAAIGIQQILERHRADDGSLLPKVRIGVHTGKAVVEQKDIFGDMVNVASKVSDHARGCEICVSGGAASKVGKKAFNLIKSGSLLPKGKRKPIAIYECRWRKHPSLIEGVGEDGELPLVRRQKLELVFCCLAGLGAFYFLAHRYLRYLAADFELLAPLAFKLSGYYLSVPMMLTAALALLPGPFVLLRRRKSQLAFRLLKGAFGFALAFFLFFLPAEFFSSRIEETLAPGRWSGELYVSRHFFVEVLEDDTGLHARPSERTPVLARARRGDVLILYRRSAGRRGVWYEVSFAREKYGWVREAVPPEVGVPERRLARAVNFTFRYKDLYALLAGLGGLLWGFLSFRIRPA